MLLNAFFSKCSLAYLECQRSWSILFYSIPLLFSLCFLLINHILLAKFGILCVLRLTLGNDKVYINIVINWEEEKIHQQKNGQQHWWFSSHKNLRLNIFGSVMHVHKQHRNCWFHSFTMFAKRRVHKSGLITWLDHRAAIWTIVNSIEIKQQWLLTFC